MLSEWHGADLTGSNFYECAFEWAQFPTVFEGANLSDVTFAGADLVGANFVGVKSIAGADFSAAIGVDRALNLANAPGAESAIWP